MMIAASMVLAQELDADRILSGEPNVKEWARKYKGMMTAPPTV